MRKTLLTIILVLCTAQIIGAASLTKTTDTVVLPHQAVTHPGTVKGAAQDVSTKFAATFYLYHCSVEAIANTNPGTFLIQAPGSSSGNEDWITIYSFTVSATTADTEQLIATEPAGETVLAVASTTGFVPGDYVYIQDTGTLADSEWGRVQRKSIDASITLVDGLTNAKDSSDVIWNDADLLIVSLDLTAITRIRIIFQLEGNVSANSHIKALMVTGDSIG